MTVILKLDVGAIAAIFPEGSEARLELQKAVIAEFVRKHLREGALGEDVRATIERGRTDALEAVKTAKLALANQTLKEMGVDTQYGGRIVLSGAAKEAVQQASRDAVRDEVSSVVRVQVDAAADRLRGTITHDAQAAVNRLVDAEIRAAVKARVEAVVAGLKV